MLAARALKRLIPALLLLGALLPLPLTGAAQVRGGATLTVLRGTVGVVQANGSPISPAPSGMSLGVGDRVATVASSGAMVTFFDGSELEMGADTAIVIRDASGEGARTTITIESIVGSTIHKVVTLTDAGSSYRVESGGTVGLVHGTLFGHHVDASGDVTVALAGCGEVAGPSSQPCLEFPRPGLLMRPGEVRTATARGDIVTDSFSLNAPLFSVIAEPVEPGNAPEGTDNPGIRTGSREAPQSQSQQPNDDDKDRPAPTPTSTLVPVPAQSAQSGQTVLTAAAPVGSTILQVSSQAGFLVGDLVTIGNPGNQEAGQIAGFGSIILTAPTGRDHQAGEPVIRTGSAVPTPTNTPTTSGPTQPCNSSTISGGNGVTNTVHQLARTGGTFLFSWDALSQPDRFEIFYQGQEIFDTGFVSFTGSHSLTYGPGAETTITVRVTGSGVGTVWSYVVSCPP